MKYMIQVVRIIFIFFYLFILLFYQKKKEKQTKFNSTSIILYNSIKLNILKQFLILIFFTFLIIFN